MNGQEAKVVRYRKRAQLILIYAIFKISKIMSSSLFDRLISVALKALTVGFFLTVFISIYWLLLCAIWLVKWCFYFAFYVDLESIKVLSCSDLFHCT